MGRSTPLKAHVQIISTLICLLAGSHPYILCQERMHDVCVNISRLHPPRLLPPAAYIHVVEAEAQSGLTKVQLAMTQVNMIKILLCHVSSCSGIRGDEHGEQKSSGSPKEEPAAA